MVIRVRMNKLIFICIVSCKKKKRTFFTEPSKKIQKSLQLYLNAVLQFYETIEDSSLGYKGGIFCTLSHSRKKGLMRICETFKVSYSVSTVQYEAIRDQLEFSNKLLRFHKFLPHLFSAVRKLTNDSFCIAKGRTFNDLVDLKNSI